MSAAVDPDIQRLNDDYCAAYNLTVYRREQGGWKIATTTFNVRE